MTTIKQNRAVKITADTLPAKFKFIYHADSKLVYHASVNKDVVELNWHSIWKNMSTSTSYDIEEVIKFINDGDWIIEQEFNVDNLKANQRVVTRNGKNAVVFVDSNDNKFITYLNEIGMPVMGFDKANFDTTGNSAYYAIVEVYEQPSIGAAHNFNIRGERIYKENVAELNRAKDDLSKAAKEIEDATRRFEAAKALVQRLEA